MARHYIGEIRIFAGNFAPVGWELCEGQLMAITDFEELFHLIGTSYGGDGQNTFALPDLRGRLPIHRGDGVALAEAGGIEEIALTAEQLPAHTHAMHASVNSGVNNSPAGAVIAHSPSLKVLIQDAPGINLSSAAITTAGGGEPHTNLQPYLCLNVIIAMYGHLPHP